LPTGSTASAPLRTARFSDYSQSGFIQKEQINYEQGGYYHVYYPTDPTQIANDIQRMLNGWYAKMGQLIRSSRTSTNTQRQTPKFPPRANRIVRRSGRSAEWDQ